ncbi:MAG: phosphoglycolate phosphatase [Alphaproteobacteria bacterium]|nr:phosphoglycolate phosphatase [Alphaproteobacteria bacterium]
MSNQTVVFDLDGTLIDTAPDLILATNHVLADAGFEAVNETIMRPVISFGSRAMITAGIRHQGAEASEAAIDAMFAKLIDFYGSNIAVKSAPFPGLVNVLDELQRRGMTIAICTNKREDMAKLLMKELGLAAYFSVITGRDTFPVCKPHPEHLLGAIRAAGGSANRSVMVGDSTTDYETAKAANVPIIGVTFGYTDIPVVELDCEAVITHYDEFLPALERLMPA